MKNIWRSLQRPIFILAPMDDVTDTVFRQMILTTHKPDLFFTEFTNVDGMLSAEGNHIVKKKLKFDPVEHPIIAQVWGNNPDHFYKSSKIIKDLGFDGIDINLGCPIPDVVKKGCGGGLIGNIKLSTEIVEAALEGSHHMPISVKTRLGIKKIETEDWVQKLLSLPLSAITIHARTVSEMSKGPAHWDEIKKAVEVRNSLKKETLIIGNGDVKKREEGLLRIKETGADGIMIGRGIFHDVYAFATINNKPVEISVERRLELLERHVKLYQKVWAHSKPYANLKKYFKIYINGFDGASLMRVKFMETHNFEEVFSLLKSIRFHTQIIIDKKRTI
ncbi:hypothetical protein A3D77_03545 [Candidatus Gottesmanbacteria bacterium RIFCSPHIGHO2_02_FULL_39_11]|uniref:tRNA-dihydrouridine synthase n=1 Tax=Candidatus Gottesmanbacteria bacterium RIFCSPHIGHO2_02_FULL_39_11 TaxID=1798382 RepID=A0A1F5ZN80_9BACT|nr:MAG: hypothetical protein A3D77_03545 [Candidatus Gottesmanbacteria bacterium RIFCSPHIGHO2_02_FULL_39_11]